MLILIEMFEKNSRNNTKNKMHEKILMLHLAYSLTCGHDISKKKNYDNKFSPG